MKQIIHTACNDWTKEADASDVTYVITTSGGFWGRGANVKDAIEATTKAGAHKLDKAVVAVLVGAKPEDCYVDGNGGINYNSGAVLNQIAVSKFSAIQSLD